MSWQQTVSTFLYYTIEVSYMVAVIAYVAQSFGWIGQVQVKGDVSGQMNQTWGQASTILASAADIAKKVNKVLEGGGGAAPVLPPDATKKDQ